MRQAFGPYTLTRPIAVGGIGEVFAAEHSGGTCAIKRLHLDMAARPEQVDLFRAEGALASRLSHPNLVSAIDTGEIDGRHYIAMDLVPGGNLTHRLESGAPSRSRALCIAIELCAGLARMHETGYAHCDVSPSNVLFAADGRARLTDFGVASPLGTQQTEVRGTYGYMSPEQARGAGLLPASDVFSVGVILWELLASARLFHRDAQHLTLAAVVEDSAPCLGDEPLDRIVARALDKNPTQRYASCNELAAALTAILDA